MNVQTHLYEIVVQVFIYVFFLYSAYLHSHQGTHPPPLSNSLFVQNYAAKKNICFLGAS